MQSEPQAEMRKAALPGGPILRSIINVDTTESARERQTQRLANLFRFSRATAALLISLAYDQVANPGFSDEFQAEETVTVTAADAGPVRVGVNGGAPGPLGASGEQVTRTFTPED